MWEEQPVFWRWQGTVAIDGKLAGGPGFPIEPPHGHMRLERGLKRRDQLLEFVERGQRNSQARSQLFGLDGSWDAADLQPGPNLLT